MRAVLAGLAIAISSIVSMAAAQQSMESARAQCCVQLGGVWKRGTGGYSSGMYCCGLERAMDAFYGCVQQKTSGHSRKK